MWVTKNQLFIVLFCAHWPTVAPVVPQCRGEGYNTAMVSVWYVVLWRVCVCVCVLFITTGRIVSLFQ